MRRVAWALVLLGGCHAHQVGEQRQTMEGPPKAEEVGSARPVRSTPGGMLDEKAVTRIQHALNAHGEKIAVSGKLDHATQASLKNFQRRQSQPQTGFPDFDTLRRLGLSAQDIYLGGTRRQDQKRD